VWAPFVALRSQKKGFYLDLGVEYISGENEGVRSLEALAFISASNKLYGTLGSAFTDSKYLITQRNLGSPCLQNQCNVKQS
jgi:hypothetical protein